MDFWVWVAVIGGTVVALLLLFFVVGTPSRRRAAKREQAERLRQEAEEKLRSAAGRDAAARQEQAAAERERLTAQEQLEEADAVDPDLPAPAARPDATMRRPPRGCRRAGLTTGRLRTPAMAKSVMAQPARHHTQSHSGAGKEGHSRLRVHRRDLLHDLYTPQRSEAGARSA